jgi:hypothetical protein
MFREISTHFNRLLVLVLVLVLVLGLVLVLVLVLVNSEAAGGPLHSNSGYQHTLLTECR